ncbi:hypothetical protein JCM10908_005189 [Rhodotorula pacifica]|uniref:uncharacterized protein n=1 Tax=Rhodotorula pacifica TaxID=1495444 RepID=UPI003182534F
MAHSLSSALPVPQGGSKKPPVLILDGGMGTTLQAPPFNLALDSALWSSELLASQEGRQQLVNLHKTWIEAGADIVQTCTYQSTLPLFLPPPSNSNSTPPSQETISSALSTMTSALPVAASACSPSSSSSQKRARVALSLGPYGSSLQPGQEYTGAYPPPFGPRETAAPEAKPGCDPTALEACPLPLEEVGASYRVNIANQEEEVHLAAWHLQRLQHLSTSANWNEGEVDLLAFETVPSLTEIRAIRKAMHIFTRTHFPSNNGAAKAFYISLVFPRTSDSDAAVRFPDPELAHLPTLADQVPLLVRAALAPQEEEGYALPGGLGFNCTSPLHARQVVRLLSNEVATLSSTDTEGGEKKPWLLVYPDGGAVYDVKTRTWHHPTGLTDKSWAKLVADSVAEAVDGSVWAGVVLGGCCKAGPGAIKALREEVEQRGWRR